MPDENRKSNEPRYIRDPSSGRIEFTLNGLHLDMSGVDLAVAFSIDADSRIGILFKHGRADMVVAYFEKARHVLILIVARFSS